LQAEHIQRLFDLTQQSGNSTAAMKPIANLASMQLKDLKTRIDGTLNAGGDKLDDYTRSHLLAAQERIQKWIDGKYDRQAPAGVPLPFFVGSRAE
jgi:hypothetical protein